MNTQEYIRTITVEKEGPNGELKQNGFSISPFDLPLKPDLFIAKPEPFWGNFGVFEDSLPDGCGQKSDN